MPCEMQCSTYTILTILYLHVYTKTLSGKTGCILKQLSIQSETPSSLGEAGPHGGCAACSQHALVCRMAALASHWQAFTPG